MEEQEDPALMKEKIYEYERKIKQQSDALKGYVRKNKKLERTIEEQKKKMEEYIQQLKEKEQPEYERKIKQQESELKRYAKSTNKMGRTIDEQRTKIEAYEHQLKEIENQTGEPNILLFLNEIDFETTKSRSVVIDGLANRLYYSEEGDEKYFYPPIGYIHSLEQRREAVIDYIDFARINWNDSHLGSGVQQDIHVWFNQNWKQFIYNPSEEEKEKSRKVFSKNFNLDNTIGTIHFVPIHFYWGARYMCFAISNYRIVEWSFMVNKEYSYVDLYNNLKQLPTWTENSKFAIEMKVKDIYSDSFIHTSNKDVFVKNRRVVTWMKNNFELGEQDSDIGVHPDIIPSLFNFIVNTYETPKHLPEHQPSSSSLTVVYSVIINFLLRLLSFFIH